MIIVGLDGRLVHANTAFCRLLGYSNAELAALTLAEITHPDDVADDAPLTQRLLAGEITHYKTDRRYIHKGREVIWIKLTVQLIRDAYGNPLCGLGVVVNEHDMGERKQAENALHESEQRFRDLIEGSMQGIIIQRDRKPLFANQAFAEIHGYQSIDEILAMDSLDCLLAPYEIARLRSYQETRLRGGEAPVYYQLDALRKDGSVVTLQNIVRVVDWQGQPAIQSTVIDVTEQKQAEARLRAIIDAVPAMINAKNEQSRYVFMNKYQAQLYGVSPEGAVGKTAAELLNIDYGAYTRQLDRKVIVTGRPIPYFEEHFVDAHNSSHTFLTTKVPLPGTTGHTKGVATISLDITDRKRAEAALDQIKRQNELILEAAGEGIYGLDVDGKTTFVNPAAAKMIGWPREELTSRCMHSVLHHTRGDGSSCLPEDCPIYAALRDGMVHRSDEELFWRKDGSSFPVEYTSTPIREAGKLKGAVVVFRDITERKKTEDARRRSEERFRLLAEHALDVIYCYRLLPTRGFEYVSPAVATLTGYTPEEHYADPDLGHKIVHPEDRRVLEQLLQTADGFGRSISLRWIHKNGNVVWTEQRNVAVRDSSGKIVAIEGIARDITERKRAEQALRESEQRFRDLIEGSIQGILIHCNGKLIFANQAFADILGYDSPDEILAMGSWLTHVAPRDRVRLGSYTKAHARGEETPSHYEYDAIRKDGPVVTLQNVVRAVNWRGQPAVQSTVIDVTERKRALDALRDSERRLAEAQLIAHVGNWERTVSTGELYWSDEVYRIFGVRPQELAPTYEDFLSRVHPDDKELVHAAVQKALNRNKPYSLDHRIVRSNGEVRIVHEQAEIKFDTGGRPMRMVGTVQDITERKQAEEVLRRYKQIVSASSDFVSFIDSNYIYRAVNTSYLQALGKTKEQFVGRRMADVLGGEIFATVVKPNVDRCLAGERINYQYWYEFQQRGRRYLDARYDPFHENDGSVSGVVVNIRDITDNKQVEDELRASRQRLRNLAARLEAVREEERAVIAREIHDELGQALTGLKLDLAWLAERLAQKDKAFGERVCAMSSLLDSTLDTVRRLSTRLRPALLDDLGLEAAVEWYMRDFAERTNCKHTLRTDVGRLDMDRGRDTALFRIFQEALTNIARHANARHVTVDLSRTDSQLVLTVSDDGRGISPEAIASTRSLGLIGMRERARAIGGQVQLQPRQTGGTRVDVRVPIVTSPPAVQES